MLFPDVVKLHVILLAMRVCGQCGVYMWCVCICDVRVCGVCVCGLYVMCICDGGISEKHANVTSM